MEEQRARRSPSLGLVLLLAIILGLVGGVLGSLLTAALRPPPPPRVVRLTSPTSLSIKPGAGGTPGSFADIAETVIPAVVNIDTVIEVAGDGNRDFLHRLLPFSNPPRKEREGIGSGFIVRSDGLILTNEHVVNDAKRIQVTLSNGRNYTGRLLGKDRELDVAVIKIDADGLPTAPLGDSAVMRPGDWALAVGSPLGLSSSVALGVVSALNRPIHVSDRTYSNLIQTDASISPGNSGGPLVNAAGQVIGINTAIQIDMGQAIIGAATTRIGFAVPINSVNDVLKEMIRTGHVTRPWIGITMRMISEDDVKRWHLPTNQGVIVDHVLKDSPAERAGLLPRDIIIKVDGKPAQKMDAVQRQVRAHKVGDTVTFDIKRESTGGQWRTTRVKVKTAQMPDQVSIPVQPERK